MISVVLFIVLGLLLITDFCMYAASGDNAVILAANFLFVTSQVGFLFVYFKYIRKTNRIFLKELFGPGDILMMLCMALVFPLPELIFYLMASYILGIGFAFINFILKRQATIPLAGVMSFVYAGLLTSAILFGYTPFITFTT